ncbi:MAG: DUF4157 domain-containing protein [Candidatus Methanoperedens sp.]|nr:DUF4157 domain-containing protein [Candidatus Methanoperedens sp.]
MNMQMVKTSPDSSFTPVNSWQIQRRGKNERDEDCPKCRKRLLNRQRSSANLPEPSSVPQVVPSIVHHVLNSPGQPLDTGTRAFMEPRLGHDFSKVRVHADIEAAESAQAVNALAYTVGQDVVFGPGKYAPKTDIGKKLLAHELIHVVQQDSGERGIQTMLTISSPDNPLEHEARMGAMAIMKDEIFTPTPLHAVHIARQDAGIAAAAPKVYTFSITTDGCDKAPFNDATVRAAARAAFDKVLTSNCVKSQSLKDEILSEFDGLNIDCEQDKDGPCGMASRYFTQTVNIYPPSLDTSRCGALASSILHEIVHLTEWRLFGHGELADACEKSCFGYGSGDASKCK